MDEMNYYLFKDIFFSGDYKILNKKTLIINFINKFSMIQELVDIIKIPNVEVVKEKQGDINLTYFYNENIKKDGYEIVITEDCISLSASNERGLLFAQNALEKVIEFQGDRFIIPICAIEDEPDFELRGIIEGFYGTPWSFNERKRAIDFIRENRMNTYMYAPKDDPYHREKWRHEYPKEILKKMRDLKEHSEKNFVDFYYCISPGKDIDITENDDMEALLNKIEQMIDIGVKDFALLLDDIDYSLKDNHKIKYRRIGQVHGVVCNKVYDFLKNNLCDFNLIICPSEYWQNYFTIYRKDLNEILYSDIKVFWTGYNTIAKQITKTDCSIVSENIGKKLILWDNIPVNDMGTDVRKMFLSPVLNRSKSMSIYNHIGIMINPMPHFELSKITMICYSHFMWNSMGYNPYLSQKIAAMKLGGAQWEAMLEFSRLNENSRVINDYHYSIREAVEDNKFNKIKVYFNNLDSIISELSALENKELLLELKPWLERGQYDILVFEKLIKSIENGEDIKEGFKDILHEIQEQDFVIGVDLINKILTHIMY